MSDSGRVLLLVVAALLPAPPRLPPVLLARLPRPRPSSASVGSASASSASSSSACSCSAASAASSSALVVVGSSSSSSSSSSLSSCSSSLTSSVDLLVKNDDLVLSGVVLYLPRRGRLGPALALLLLPADRAGRPLSDGLAGGCIADVSSPACCAVSVACWAPEAQHHPISKCASASAEVRAATCVSSVAPAGPCDRPASAGRGAG